MTTSYIVSCHPFYSCLYIYVSKISGDRNVATTTRVTTGRPTVGPWQICPNQQTVFKGQVGVIYEMLPASTQQNAINAFVENVLLNSNFYGLALDILTHDNRTLVTAIPYPTTDKYNVQGYGSARSVDEFRNQVIAFNGMIQPISQSSSISDALLYVTTSLPAGGVKSSLIIVGNSAAMIDNIAPILTNQLRSDFDIYTVGVGSGAVDLSPLSSGTGFSFTGDTQQVADQIGLKMASSSPSVYCPPPVTTVRPTVGPCQCTGRWVYNGDLAIAFENIKTNGSQSVANFLSNTLLKNPDSYGLTNDVNGNQPSQLTLIPYPDSNTYPTYPYGWIRSVNDIGNYIDAISPLPLATPDPRISDALTFISAQPTTLNSKVVLLVGSNGTNVNAAMDSANQLKNAGYLVITVAQTTAASVFQPLASGSQFALHIGDGNDDAVAAQIASMSLIDLQSNVDTLYINAFSMRDATISDGLVWLINNYPYGINTIIIVVGYHDDENPATTTFILETLRAQGYKVITVAAGVGHGDLSGIADKPEWYFQVNDSNGQTIADAISEVLCSLQFL
nr:hypothetical protein T19D12.2 - Caenorhabditis elegans [Caenorhabditis elegans]